MTLLDKSRAERVLDAEDLDGLLANSLENLYYLTGIWCESAVGLPRQAQFFAVAHRARLDEPTIVCGLNEIANVLGTCPPATPIIPFGRFYRFVGPEAKLGDLERGLKEWVIDGLETSRPGPVEALVEALEKLGLERGRVAYDERGLLTLEVKAEVERRLPGLRLVPGYSTYRRIRAVKTPLEVDRLRRVLALNERSILAAMAIAQEGVSEREMVAEYERTVVTGGGRPSITQIFFGANGSSGYVVGRDATLTRGEVIRFDVACFLDGYASDIARNFSLGPPAAGARVLQYYEALLTGETVAIEAMRPGVPASEVFHTAVAAARRAGIPHYDRSHVGHGVGLEIYDIPLLGPNDHTPLEAGMVFQVELPYYELAFPGLQVEDTVLVGEHRAEILGSLDRAFAVVERPSTRARRRRAPSTPRSRA